MIDNGFTNTFTPSVQVVAEALIEYAQRDYEAKRIGWNSYAAYTLALYNALCGNECDATEDTDAERGT